MEAVGLLIVLVVPLCLYRSHFLPAMARLAVLTLTVLAVAGPWSAYNS